MVMFDFSQQIIKGSLYISSINKFHKVGRIMLKSIYLIILILLYYSIVEATIINVPTDQPTIQAGIDSAATGDTVLVQPGLYFENINFKEKNITVGSLFLINGDTSFISQTVIDANNRGSVVMFSRGEDSTAILTGFTLQRGSGIDHVTHFWSEGGGIYCTHSSPTLKNLIIKDNTYASDGGGIFFESSLVRLYDSVIINNFVSGMYGGVGGGILIASSTGKIKNITFKNNISTGDGAGIVLSHSNITLDNILFVENECHGNGAAIAGWKSNVILQNITSINNSASLSGGGIHCIDSTNIKIINSIFWNDSPNVINFAEYFSQNSVVALYSDIQGGIDSIRTNNNGSVYWLDGNIDLDPQFADTLISNYNLSSTSPCIDAGIQDTFIVYNNNFDTIMIPPINYKGLAPDMGAFEFDPATILPNEVDSPPSSFKLYQNYPNPFNPSTKIKYELPKPEKVRIEIFNILGQKIKTLLNKQMSSGLHEIKFIAKGLPSGVYLYNIKAEKYHKTKKMILLK